MCVLEFIENLPKAFKDMESKNTSLQHTLIRLMKTGSTDGYMTRLWSTCPSLIKINGLKRNDVDKRTYIFDDTTSPVDVTSILECVQKSSKQMLIVTEEKGEEASCGDIYAHFLIEGHTLSTHYVSMNQEFPDDEDIDPNITEVSSRCRISDSNNKTIVLVALDFVENKVEGLNQTGLLDVLKQSTSVVSNILRPTIWEVLEKLLERLLKDGVGAVVVLTITDKKAAITNMFAQVTKKVNEVSIHPA
jgi:hypothetical protein